MLSRLAFWALVAVCALPFERLSAQALSLEECRALYRRELDVSMSDPAHPHHDALKAARAALLSDAAVRAQTSACPQNVARPVYQCSMKARTFAEILGCRSVADAAKREEHPVENKTQDPGQNPADNKTPKQTNIDPLPVKVDASSCGKAYFHLLSVYETSELLKKRPDRGKLLNYWRSKEASESFQKRCTSMFRPQDVGCLLATKDVDVIQGCLIVIPDKK